MGFIGPNRTVAVRDLPLSAQGVIELFQSAVVLPAYCVMEAPQPIPHQRARSIATFWERLGFIEGVLTVMHIPLRLIRPQDWRQMLGCRARGTKEAKLWSAWKAAQLYPQLDLGRRASQDRADAILIAVCARRLYARKHGETIEDDLPVVQGADSVDGDDERQEDAGRRET